MINMERSADATFRETNAEGICTLWNSIYTLGICIAQSYYGTARERKPYYTRFFFQHNVTQLRESQCVNTPGSIFKSHLSVS